MKRKGFTLIEVLIVIAIISVLATLVFTIGAQAYKTARDGRRKSDISEIGHFLVLACPIPNGGSGDYDLKTVIDEFKVKYPQAGDMFVHPPADPVKGTSQEYFYRYIVDASARKCSVYANLESQNSPVSLPDIHEPTAGGGVGTWEAGSPGWNGTTKYFQYSN